MNEEQGPESTGTGTPSDAPIPPAPGWWLASDGNWYPPQATPGGPPPTGAGKFPAPPPQTDNAGPNVVAIVVGAVAVVLLLLVVSVVAITFLGQKASSKFSSVGSAVAGTVIVAPHR